jgi:two-component sensor histidine kinase
MGSFIKPEIYEYPSEIYNEWEVLEIYRIQFPEIVQEYESVVRKTFLNPKGYSKIVQEKSEIFDSELKKIIETYNEKKLSFEELIELSKQLHYTYAFNFWIISYAYNEGPIINVYTNLIENLLKKIYFNQNDVLKAKELFLRTDYIIFYHKILLDSIVIADMLNQIHEVSLDLQKARMHFMQPKNVIFDEILLKLKNSEEDLAKKLLKKLDRHLKKNNLAPIYNLFNQAIDYYEKNKILDLELKDIGLRVNLILNLAKEQLSEEDYNTLVNLYFLIKEMLKAKDETYGRKDPELFAFWNMLVDEIILLAEEKFKIKVDKERSNLLIPWILYDYFERKSN